MFADVAPTATGAPGAATVNGMVLKEFESEMAPGVSNNGSTVAFGLGSEAAAALFGSATDFAFDVDVDLDLDLDGLVVVVVELAAFLAF